MRIKTGAPTRSLAAIESASDDTYTQARENKQELISKLKAMKADLKRARDEKDQAQRDLKDVKKRKLGGKGHPAPSNTVDAGAEL